MNIIERLRIESRREPHEPIWRDAIDEIEALREEVERLKSITAVTMGVGSGDGNLFVHGDWESIKAAQAIVLERGALRAAVERDEALLREALYALEYASDMTKPEDLQGCGCPICTNIAALRERLGG